MVAVTLEVFDAEAPLCVLRNMLDANRRFLWVHSQGPAANARVHWEQGCVPLRWAPDPCTMGLRSAFS